MTTHKRSRTDGGSEGGSEATSNGDATTLEPKIAHHGAYIDETKTLLREYRRLESFDGLKERVVEENILNKSTDYYRKSVLREVARRYIPDKNVYSETPLMYLLEAGLREEVEDWCLYYEFAQDPFIRFLTLEYLYPEFERGSLAVESDDVVDFLEEIQPEYDGLREKEASTIEEAASKYLAAMKNFGLLEGRQRKEFAITYVPDEAIAYVVYRLWGAGVDTARGVIEHEDWQLLLLDEPDIQRRMQDLSSTYVRYEKRGSTERLELLYDDIQEAIDAF